MYSIIERKQIKKGKSINEIVNKNGIPDQNTIYNWLNKDAQFKDNYVHAREQQALFYAEKIEKVIEKLKEDTTPTREKTDIARLEVDSLKWIASKLLPKVYGTQAQTNNIQVNVTPVTGMQIIDDFKELEE